jgi:hypothetical protein
VAKRADPPVATARRVVREDELRREVAVERQTVVVGSREDRHVLDRGPTDYATVSRRVLPAPDRTHHLQQGVLALVDDRGRERPERPVERVTVESEKHLRERGAADRDVNRGCQLSQGARERVRGLYLSREGHGDADQRHLFPGEAPGQRAKVRAEGIAPLLRVFRDLLRVQQRERSAVRDEVDRQRVMRRAHDALRSVDRGHGLGVGGRVVEAPAAAIAQDSERVFDGAGGGGRVASGRPQRAVRELVLVRQRGLGVELREAVFDALGELLQVRPRQQRLPGLEVRVDREHVDSMCAEPRGERRDAQIGRRGIARRRVNESDSHGHAKANAP